MIRSEIVNKVFEVVSKTSKKPISELQETTTFEELKLDSLDADSSTVAVGKVIKKLYSKATTELLIKNNSESIALPKHAKFLDTNTFIISLKG